MHSEITHTVYIAVAAILLALVLGLVSLLISVKADLACLRNNELYAARNLQIYREFNKYADKEVYGEDVVEAIRTYYDTNVSIYVDDYGENKAYFVDKYEAKRDPSLVDTDELQDIFKPTHKFKAVLVYDCVDPSSVTKSIEGDKSSLDVTSIVFLYQGTR